MAVAEFNKNGDETQIPQLEEDVMKIIVVGEQKCGKTTFIRTFAGDNFDGEIYQDTGSTVYKYSYYHNGELRKYAFVEIPGVLVEHFGEAIANHVEAKSCIFMFAIDDPSSLQQLRVKWIPKLHILITLLHLPTMAVGFKADLREDQQAIARLALANLTPVTTEEGQSLTELPEVGRYFECSRNDLQKVNDACTFILNETYEYTKQ